MDPNIENYVYGVGLSPVSCKEGDARFLYVSLSLYIYMCVCREA